MLIIYLFKLGLTPGKCEKPLQGIELQEKEKDENNTRKLFSKNLKIKRSLLSLNVKLFRS